jgi:hypothetical protein
MTVVLGVALGRVVGGPPGVAFEITQGKLVLASPALEDTEERASSGETAGCDAKASFDVGPDCDLYC